MLTYNYPDGTSLVSTALAPREVETVFQQAAAQMLGLLTSPVTFGCVLTIGSNLLVTSPTQNLGLIYVGQQVTGTGIPPNTVVTQVVALAHLITISNTATIGGSQAITFTDIDVWSKVRIGWAQTGQPFGGINDDVCYIMCEPIDTDYSRLRDNQLSSSGDVVTQKDVFTRSWKAIFTFYGPKSVNNAKAVNSGLLKLPFIDALLAASNLYINPSIKEPARVPELFQGQWWERVDLEVELNEQITETLTVGAVESVEIQIYTKDGLVDDFMVTAS